MAKFVIKDATVDVDGTDLSDHVAEVAIETEFDEAEATSMGAVYKEVLQGFGDATITVTFHQDFDAGSVDDVLWPLSQSGDTFPLKIKPFSDAVSAANPEYQLTASLLSYSPLSGGAGEVASTEVSFRNSSQTGITRDVTP
jgi:hypothetical protein